MVFDKFVDKLKLPESPAPENFGADGVRSGLLSMLGGQWRIVWRMGSDRASWTGRQGEGVVGGERFLKG